MADQESGERTEQATDAKREEFRKQGQVAQTRELAGALLFLASAATVYILGQFFFSEMYSIFFKSFGPDMVKSIRSGEGLEILQFAAVRSLLLILPVALVAALIGVISQVAQTGFMQVEDAMSPNFDRLNPVEGFKKIFSLRGLAEGIKSVLKLLLIGAIFYYLLKSEVRNIPYVVTYSAEQLLAYLGALTVRLLMGIGFTLIALAIADYFFQRWDLEKKMMMTKQEIKEEMRQREGDPQIKARIRRIQREMANKRMMADIPKADVVITNPTHIACVLKYDSELPAPQLVAKGADIMAEKIKEIARQHNIPIVENKPLARTIFKTMKIGQVIPRELFVAVAEVLSYVFKLRRRKARN